MNVPNSTIDLGGFLKRCLEIQPLRIQSPSQMMIGVYNHLLRKVFRFHYHSQKVIGSLGNIFSSPISKARSNFWGLSDPSFFFFSVHFFFFHFLEPNLLQIWQFFEGFSLATVFFCFFYQRKNMISYASEHATPCRFCFRYDAKHVYFFSSKSFLREMSAFLCCPKNPSNKRKLNDLVVFDSHR